MDGINVVDENELYRTFENADTVLLKKYINNLSDFGVVKTPDKIEKIKVGENIALFHLKKLVYDENENIHDKLMTVYTSFFSKMEASLVMILCGKKDRVDLYIGVALRDVDENGKINKKRLDRLAKNLRGAMMGNFPGSELKPVDAVAQKNEKGENITDDPNSIIEKCFDKVNTVLSVSGIAELRNQNFQNSESFVQGMEKLIDSMRGKTYTAIYIADMMSDDVIDELCSSYEDIYSQLSPFRQSVKTLGENNSATDTKTLLKGIVDTTNESLTNTITHGTSKSVTKTDTVSASVNAGIKLGEVFEVGASVTTSHSDSETEGTNESESKATTTGKAKSLSTQNSIANALTKGTSETVQVTYENKSVISILDKVDEQIKRLKSCENFGLFNTCVYFISKVREDAMIAANNYRSLIRGDGSSAETSAINVWVTSDQSASPLNNNNRVEEISKYLKRLYHPLFGLDLNKGSDELIPVSPAFMVSGKELAYQFSLPKKSVSGLPVIKCAEFGRNVMTVDGDYNGDVPIGKIYHMHNVEKKSVVKLSKNDLTAHAFVTGSTGAGKSNAIYKIIDELKNESNIHFLVVEPAKGEYKDVFGNMSDVSVYGTNPNHTPLLRINPFRFPEGTHIYEHMDRLVEIFNVCWPMYAAMPAVLKAALEKAYIQCGWDLEKSINRLGVNIFPSFGTLAHEVKMYLDMSEYSDENKGNYKGALLTRLESLTNGINGMIFTADDLKDDELFDNNVIVDLSRVGSVETKSLIMGILVMKLQEHRMESGIRNSELRHITILEEAHNLLKRTSTEQTSEGANLLGKSVEMLSNAIAEMRTYGEGFIIADQSPGLLDMSVIRNTNTKIVLRLPDYSDRELVGKAANLNDSQIEELAKLKTGVAAVYQNNWVSPVLCLFDKYDNKDGKYCITKDMSLYEKKDSDALDVLKIIMNKDIKYQLDDVDIEKIVRSSIPDILKIKVIHYLKNDNERDKAKQLAEIVYQFFDSEKTLEDIKDSKDINDWIDRLVNTIKPSIKDFEEDEITKIIALLVHEHYIINKSYEPIYLNYMKYVDDKLFKG